MALKWVWGELTSCALQTSLIKLATSFENALDRYTKIKQQLLSTFPLASDDIYQSKGKSRVSNPLSKADIILQPLLVVYSMTYFVVPTRQLLRKIIVILHEQSHLLSKNILLCSIYYNRGWKLFKKDFFCAI